MRRKRLWRACGALASGLCICAAMPPWGWWPLAFVGIAGWATLNRRPLWSRRFAVGALVSLGWFLPSTLWMVRFSPAGWPVGVAIWFPLVGGAISAVCPPDRRGPAVLVGGLVLSEWFRWHAPFGGVPLSMLCMTQARGPLLGVARIGGALAVTACIAGLGAALAWATDALLNHRMRPLLGVAGVLAGVAALLGASVLVGRAPDGRSIEVAAVQGGGPQETRSFNTDYSLVLNRHLDETQRVRTPVDLVLWPENVVNVDRWDGSTAQREVEDLARRLQTTIILGVVQSAGQTHFTNEAIAIGPDGRVIDRYDKQRRVPFGEYVPLRFMLQPLAGATLPGRDALVGRRPAVIHTDLGRVGVAISWEIFFSRITRDAARHGAVIMLNPTNGSSYWLTQVQTQQLAMSTLRAVETDRWLVQAAPTGFSAIIDPDGNLQMHAGIGTPAVLQRRISERSGWSPAVRLGNWPALALGIVLVLVGARVDRLRRRSDAPT